MTLTLRDRVLKAGITEAALTAHLEAGRIRVDGHVVADPDTPVPDGVDFGIYTGPPPDRDAVAAELAAIRERTKK